MNEVKAWIKLKTGKCDDYKHWDGGTALHLAAELISPKNLSGMEQVLAQYLT